MVKLRMKRFGRRNRAFFRVDAIDARRAPKGLAIEELGFYDPVEKDPAKAVRLNADRIQYWLGVGAQPSDSVRSLLQKAGIPVKPSRRATFAAAGKIKPKKVAVQPAKKAEGGAAEAPKA